MIVDAVIEIPLGSQTKYEFDEESGMLRLNRVMPSPVVYPANYGYLANTLADDGDALDILVLSNHAYLPNCLVPARVIGILDMTDDKGRDMKVLSVCAVDPYQRQITALSDIPRHTLKAISHFFSVYKELEGRTVEVGEWLGKEAAIEEIALSRQRFEEQAEEK